MRRLGVVGLLGCLLGAAQAAERPPTAWSLEEVLSRPWVSEAALSNDGERLAYVVMTPDLAANRYRMDVRMRELRDGDDRRVAELEPTPAYIARTELTWSPDGRRLGFIGGRNGGRGLFVADVETEGGVRSFEAGLPSAVGVINVGTLGQMRWSPDGRRLGFTVPLPDAAGDARQPFEVGPNWAPPFVTERVIALGMLDVDTGRISVHALDGLSVHSFAWAPDGERLAVAAATRGDYGGFMRTDLYLLDTVDAQPRPLVAQPGPDVNPRWSPDGRRIAFATQAGRIDWDQHHRLGIVEVAVGRVIYPLESHWARHGGHVEGYTWLGDLELLASAQQGFGVVHLRIDVHDPRPQPLQLEDEGVATLVGAAPRAQRLAAVVEDVTRAPALAWFDLRTGRRQGLIELGPTPAGAPLVEELRWPSADGTLRIPGLLVRPPGAKANERRPLLVFVNGGPFTPRRWYNLGAEYPLLAFAQAGYLVFMPNTRGRGGFGLPLRHAIRNHRDYAPGPFSDVMTGIDRLVARGEADPGRIGMMGFSYGGYLTAYAIGQTDRFAAASIMDAGSMEITNWAYTIAVNEPKRAVSRDLLGFGSVYDPVARQAMIDQSPMTYVSRVRTPTLFEYGSARTETVNAGLMLYQGLLAHGVHARMLVYPRTGHGILEPVLRVESGRRNLQWFEKHVPVAAVFAVRSSRGGTEAP